MKRLFYSCLIPILLISCTTDSSETIQKLDPNLLAGEVVDRNGNPLPDVDIFVLYISEDEFAPSSNLSSYPNPFVGNTTIGIENRTAGFEYILKAVNIDETIEIEIANQVLSNEGYYEFNWELQSDTEKGIYILQDNLNNERVVLHAPRINNGVLRFEDNLQPRSAGYVAGGLIGEEITTTNDNGEFVFEKDMLMETNESLKMVRTDETGLELGDLIISDKINVVAYVDELNYAFKEIDYKKDKDFDLKLIIP